jgi:Tol biopolymer transport system component
MPKRRITPPLMFAILFGVCALSVAQERGSNEPIPEGIILFGATMIEEPDVSNVSTIQMISATGEKIRVLHRSSTGTVTFGRLSRQRDRIAFSKSSLDGTHELWLLDEQGNSRKIADGGPTVTAWSPDGKQIAFY